MVKHKLLSPLLTGLVALTAMTLVGCQTASTLTLRNKTWHRDDVELRKYEQVDLVYEVNHAESGLSKNRRKFDDNEESAEVAEPLFGTVSQTETSVSPWSKAKVQVTYPHPRFGEQMAQVTLRLSHLAPNQIETSYVGLVKKLVHRRSKNSGIADEQELTNSSFRRQSQIDDEIWTATLTKEQLDVLLKEIKGGGFFGHQERPYACSELSLTIDRESVSKSWTQEPRLDQLIEYTYQQGELVGFVTPEKRDDEISRPKRLLAKFKSLTGQESSIAGSQHASEAEIAQIVYESQEP